MAVVDIITSISKTIDDLLDFVVRDEYLSHDFENYLVRNNIQIELESQLNDILISYILDEKTTDNVLVLDYFNKKNSNYEDKIINSLKNSFLSVFRVNKILKNAYVCESLVNETDFSLIPLVKMTNLRGIGLYDFIKARIIEFNGDFYLLEIYDCFGQYKEYEAYQEAIKYMIKNPASSYYLNVEKYNILKNSVKSFHDSFLECFKCNEVVTKNTLADAFLREFNKYHSALTNSIDEKSLIEHPESYSYFDIESENENYLENASMGFLNVENGFDVGFYTDLKTGLCIIPFLGTFNKILEDNSFETVDNAKKCIESFLKSDKISPDFLLNKQNQYGNLISLINAVTKKNFTQMEEIINFYKAGWIEREKISSTIVLYNSKTFEKILGLNKNKKDIKEAGRNEPCPCGSGKKYKKCCGSV